jgi:hypothetical protein
MITVDVEDLYVNIPIDRTLHITKSKLLENNTQITQQILTQLKVALSQNYFIFEHKIYQTEHGISMRSPISSLIAEIFLQHYDDIHIKQLLDTKNIVLYTRYVDDMLTIYDTTRIHPTRYQHTHKSNT